MRSTAFRTTLLLIQLFIVQLRLLFELGKADFHSLDGSGSTALQLARNNQRSSSGSSSSTTGSSVSMNRSGSKCPSPVLEYLEWLQGVMDRNKTCEGGERTEASSVSASHSRDGSVDGSVNGASAGGLAAAAAAHFGPVSLDTTQRAAALEAPASVTAAAAVAAAAAVVVVSHVSAGEQPGDDGVRVGGGVNGGDAGVGRSSDGGGSSDAFCGGAGQRIGRVEEWARLADSGDHSMSGERQTGGGVGWSQGHP